MTVLRISTAPVLVPAPRPRLEPLHLIDARPRPVRLLLLADYVHPYVYRSGFPQGVGEVDAVLAAGDLPGSYLEFVATKLPVPVLYVPGNHDNEYVVDEEHHRSAPRGVINVHGRVVQVAGLRVAGWGGVPRYRASDPREGGRSQYSPLQARWGLGRLAWQAGSAPLDVLLTHAPPLGPHAGQDYAHRGCAAINRFMERRHPRLMVHGHIHEYEGRKADYTDEQSGAEVVNAYGYRIIELARA